jgi:hypothetical protein
VTPALPSGSGARFPSPNDHLKPIDRTLQCNLGVDPELTGEIDQMEKGLTNEVLHVVIGVVQ